MRHKILLPLAMLALGAGGFALTFRAAIWSGSCQIAVFSAIGKSQFTGSQAVEIQSGNDRWLVRDLAAVHQIMQQRGWIYDDQMGARVAYRQGSERLDVGCEAFSQFYQICKVEL